MEPSHNVLSSNLFQNTFDVILWVIDQFLITFDGINIEA